MMILKYIAWGALSWGIVLAPAGWAQTSGANEAGQLLMRMSSAMRELDYQGSFLYEHDGRIDTLRVFHDGGAVERERLVSLNGARREVVRDHDSIVCLQPGQAPLMYAAGAGRRLVPLVPNAKDERVNRNYTIELIGTDRVAGYSTQVIEVRARDPYRYGYRLWLEQDRAMLLRAMLLNTEQRPLAQFMFVAMDIGVKPKDADLTPSEMPARGVAAQVQETALNQPSLWQVKDLPEGFTLVSQQGAIDADHASEHWVYSDGLSSVSVYLEPTTTPHGVLTQDLTVRGSLSVITRRIEGYQITVLGEVPAVTVERIARSVSRVSAVAAE